MRWTIKHKSGRVLFVTSDEFIADNRRKMGWIVGEVKMTSREQFEKVMSNEYEWFSEAIACAIFCGDDVTGYYVGGNYIYHGNSCSEALFWLWRGWQASCAAIEIELPDIYSKKYSESDCCMDDFDFNIYEQDLTKTIESAGLKVKK